MRRQLAHFVFVLLCGALATVLGSAAAVTLTPTGNRLLGQLVTSEAHRVIRGSLSVHRVSGSFTGGLILDSVVVRDTLGDLLASVPRVQVSYGLGLLLAGRIVLTDVTLERPVIRLVKRRGGRMNFEEVLRLGETEPDGSPPPLIEFRSVRLVDGEVEIRTPWDPPSHLATAASRDSATDAERAKPGRILEEEPGGLVRVRMVDGLFAQLSLLRLSTPARDPMLVRIDSLAGRMSDPGIDLRSARGEVLTAGDSLTFDLPHVALPRTTARGGGRLTWPADTVLFDFQFRSDDASLTDFLWVSPDFPDLRGRAELTALSRNGLQTEYDIRGLHLADAHSAIDGELVAISHRIRGLGWRNLAVTLRNFDLEMARPYLDTLPLQGTITGPIRASGFPARLGVSLDWTFADARIEGRPLSRVALAGRVRLGGGEGIVFDSTALPAADLDLRTVRLVAPVVRLDGRLSLNGRLHGPWRNATYWGTAEHRVADLAPSVVVGRARLDTREAEAIVDVDVQLTPLMLDPLRTTYPDLPVQGPVRGNLRLAGPVRRLAIDADLAGTVGQVSARGTVGLTPSAWSAESLTVEFRDLDLAAIRGRGDPTTLHGVLRVNGEVVAGQPPEGSFDLDLAPSRVGDFPLTSAQARGRLQDGLLTVDSVAVVWAGGEVGGRGTLGWRADREGFLFLQGMATSLAPFDALLHRVTGLAPDTSEARQGLDGQVRGALAATGSLERLRGTAQLAGRGVVWERVSTDAVRALVSIDRDASAARPLRVDVQVEIDTLGIGRFRYPVVEFLGAGAIDSLRWAVRAEGGSAALSTAAGTGVWVEQDGRRTLTVDTLALALVDSRWRLAEPVRAALADSALEIGTMRLVTADGSGFIDLTGSLPGRGAGTLEVRAAGLGLRDVYGLLQRDTTGVDGALAFDAELSGTALRPRIRGTGSVTAPRFGDFRAPFVRGAFFYADQVVSSNLSFWRTGIPVVEVEARLPLDLALGAVPRRQLPGDLAIRARADSMDLAVLEAFTPNVRRVRGTLEANVTVLGTWDQPVLGGDIHVRDGGLTVPALRAAYAPVTGSIHLAGDSILVDSLRIESPEGGHLDISGGVQLRQLTQPVLALDLTAERFHVMDIPDFLRLRANASLSLRGPVRQPVLTGSGSAINSVLYFSDLVTKDIVNLEDPLNADLVDSTALRTFRLGSAFQSRFLDSLRIQRFNLRAAEDVWLRSTEANVQLQGAVVLDKVGRRGYRINGQFNALRGTYTLKLKLVTREFNVERGTVRYFGTPDLNAELDLEARHLVRSVESVAEDLPILAHITGTLLSPQLRLSTPSRLPLSQSDLAAYLIFGRLTPGGLRGEDFALEALASALTSELSRTVVASESQGVPDLFEFRPGAVQGTGQLRGLTQIVAGWQIGRKWFVTFNAGFCPGGQELTYRTFGASLEYRFRRDLSLQASAEPVQFCGSGRTLSFRDRSRYQFGGDLKWDREY